MKLRLSRIAMMAAAAGMVFSPIAAQANTRAGDSGAVYSRDALSQPGMGRNAIGSALANDEDDEISPILLGLLGGIAVIIVIILIDDEDDQSPGT